MEAMESVKTRQSGFGPKAMCLAKQNTSRDDHTDTKVL